MTFCDTLAGFEVRFGRTKPEWEPRNHGWTDRRGSRNSYLDADHSQWMDRASLPMGVNDGGKEEKKGGY